MSAASLSPGEASALETDWDRLAAQALVPALGAGAAWTGELLAALSPRADRVRVLASWGGGRKELIGIAAMERFSLLPFGTLPILRSWSPALSFSGMPLLSGEEGAKAIEGFLSTARAAASAGAILLRRVETETGMLNTVHQAAVSTGSQVALLDQDACAALKPIGDFDAWFEGSFPRKRRKEFRRLRSRLGELGRLESTAWKAGTPLEPWIADFLELERSGWKGRRGTAIACDENDSLFLRQSLPQLAARGELAFWKITLDGRPVAMLFALVGHGRAWLVKMAYDEAHARYSPGVLVVLDATEALFRRGDIRLADSCAIPNHPMIDHVWRDRIAVADVLVSTPGTSSARFHAILGLELARRRARGFAKSLYHRYVKGVLS